MTRFLLVGLGGAVGSMARYGLGLAAGRMAPASAWPFGTFTANLIGGLLMGLLVGWLALRGGDHQESLRLLLAVGVLGGFTTFSAFSLETALMLQRRDWLMAGGYVGLSVALAVAGVALGLVVMRRAFA